MEPKERTDTHNRVFETFGNYVFLKRLAAGGMAEVFLARPNTHSGNGRILVVKRLLPHVADNSMFLNMFQTEIQVIMGFNHPHTVQLHDFGEFNFRPYIAMEYIEGKNLKELMAKFIETKSKMSIPMALGLMAQAASGLSYAHTFVNKVTGEAVNAIHRDISPHNLIVSYDGNLKVIDFGIAKAASGITHEPTTVGTIKGKIAYLSPEQINGLPIDARSDIFSLGIVAWELLTLRRPFSKDGDTEMTIVGRINNCDQYIAPPSVFNSEIPPEVDEVILKALKKNPDERYSSASEFQNALRKVLQKLYPQYAYSDTSRILSTIFKEEIAKERQEIKELNKMAQSALTARFDAATMVIENTPSVTLSSMSTTQTVVPALDNVDVRLMKIENMMKQKATSRHYMMLAFYIITLILFKLDNHYSFFDFFFESKEVTTINEPTSATLNASDRPQKLNRKPASKAKKNSQKRPASSRQ